jgi:hypothetical protein
MGATVMGAPFRSKNGNLASCLLYHRTAAREQATMRLAWLVSPRLVVDADVLRYSGKSGDLFNEAVSTAFDQ